MKKGHFCQCLEAMRKHALWEHKLYECGFDLACTPMTDVLDALALCMCDFDPDWAYDEKLGINWLVEWSFHEGGFDIIQHRHGKYFDITEAGALYDFLVFMNEHGWED